MKTTAPHRRKFGAIIVPKNQRTFLKYTPLGNLFKVFSEKFTGESYDRTRK